LIVEKWQVYLQEAQTQVEFAKRAYAAFQVARSERATVDIFSHLHHFVAHATNIHKILEPKPSTERAVILAGHVDLSGIDLGSFRRLRNHLEHFDERLDRWVSEYDGHAFFDMNLIAGAKGFPKKAFLRALDGDVFKFQGEDYDMTELMRAILEIERRLTSR
jgi:hypothetical protein